MNDPPVEEKTSAPHARRADDGWCLYCRGKHSCANGTCIIALMQNLRVAGIDVIAKHIVLAATISERLGLPAPSITVNGSLITGNPVIQGGSMIGKSQRNVVQGSHGTATTGDHSPATGAESTGTQQVSASGGTASIGGAASTERNIQEQEFAEIIHAVLDRHDELERRVLSFEEREKAKACEDAGSIRDLSAELVEIWRFMAQTAKSDRDAIEGKVRGLSAKALRVLAEITQAAMTGVAEGMTASLMGR